MKGIKGWAVGVLASAICLTLHPTDAEAGTLTAGKSHIGTFEGSTTFTTSSSNGIHPGLFLEVRDADGDLKQYTSEEGVITVPNTKEGAYVTQAKLLGKTKYRDQDTGELLDQWEAGRKLRLESVENPVLTTTGNNLFDGELEIGSLSSIGIPVNDDSRKRSKDFFPFKGDIAYAVTNVEQLYFYDENKNFISRSPNRTDVSPANTCFIKVRTTGSTEVQIEKGTIATSYHPFQSNLLTVNEDLELRGIGDVRDALDLVTGEVVQSIGEIVLDGSENWGIGGWPNQTETVGFQAIIGTSKVSKYHEVISDKLVGTKNFDTDDECVVVMATVHSTLNIAVRTLRSKLTTQNVDAFKNYLSKNPITVQYQLATDSVKTVTLTSTYAFNLISDGVVKIKGNVIPTIYSVTVPSESLTFAINPNAEAGQQFIAPEFSITNEGTGPVELELKSFTQKTNVLNDVLPDQHPDWTLLDKTESRDFALALVPKASDAWLTLQEGPKYVASTANTVLGKIKPKATVDFSFTASHGTVFDQNLFPEYQLVFTFGF